MAAFSPCAEGSGDCLSLHALRAPLIGAALALLLVAGGTTLATMMPVEHTHFSPERLAGWYRHVR